MSGNYTLKIEPAHALIRVTMAGFFEPAQIAALAADVAEGVKKLKCPPGDHLTLADIRQMDIQSQEAVQHFQRLLSMPVIRSRKIAFVVARSLARLQIKRAARHRTAEYFEDQESAEAWLLEPAQPRGGEHGLGVHCA